ncbi:helix-turn-helix domain-containing protein [Nocardia terpenica]|uniref:Uncharacterized protein n=1 Tax=Nocardia terpenica TaxID=455432 RepID=A0A164H2H8_9NOCA|nr:helix-turn-helix domain-containing protein [Nocardia terpenica]KZM68143.1 hypothetical protein AWN90_09385 [Nocardia terpenica]NQE88998.1 hypothetical protein [Nocardia terpenica]
MPPKPRNARSKRSGARGGSGKITDTGRQRIIDLHAVGKGRNQIAAELGVDPRTITYWANKLGLRFDQAITAEATAARLEQLKGRRLDMAEMIAARIDDLHERLWSPHTTYERGDGELIPVTLPLPPLRDLRDGYTALSLALRSLTELVNSQANETVAADRSMLADLARNLKSAVEADHARGEPTPE